jgi:hypothetical protein
MTTQRLFVCLFAGLLGLQPLSKASAADNGNTAGPLDTSSITVNGTPSESQAALKLTVRIQSVRVDNQGHILKGTISADKFPQYALGTKVNLPPGKYYVAYSHNYNIVDLGNNEDKTIDLKPLTIKRVDGNYKIKVFTDLTAPSEQDKEMLFYWLSPIPLEFTFQRTDDDGNVSKKWSEKMSMEDFCRKATKLLPIGKQHCAALRGNDYKALAPIFKFNSDATVTAYEEKIAEQGIEQRTYFQNGELWDRVDRIFIADGVDGDTIAVMPGTYGVEITNLEGHSLLKYHIVR